VNHHPALEVLATSLRLGLTSFGGPVAHLGYFEHAYVTTRRWLTGAEYASLVALCQVLPGPASSQVSFLVGLHRAGWPGALAAWLGFTLPSALLMVMAALLAARVEGPVAGAVLHGLKLVAVAVVAQAVWTMARRLCTDVPTRSLAVAATLLLLLAGGTGTQLAVLLLGAVVGMWWCRQGGPEVRVAAGLVSPRVAFAALAGFAVLLAGLPLVARQAPYGLVPLADVFYRAGALVFGGGHVVLPLLRDALVPAGVVSDGAFLTGYGFAQALPGPLFTFAAYLGAAGTGVASPVAGALVALVAIFLPGLLLAVAGVALWGRLAAHGPVRGALNGLNAVVVGILAAALYDPVWVTAVGSVADVAIAAAGLLLLERWRVSPVVVVALTVMAAGLPALVPG